MLNQTDALPVSVQKGLNDFVGAVKQAFGNTLVSIVLYGSAAEGRLRPSSDVNVMLVLKTFDIAQINPLREKLSLYHAAFRLNVMFLLESEITIASEAFAVKFTDILSRHRILLGTDPFDDIKVSRSATLQRLRQVVINLTLRLRERYALVSLHSEKLVPIIADMAGPIRTCAATILSLEGKNDLHPKEALQLLTKQFPQHDWQKTFNNISKAREEQELNVSEEISTIQELLSLLQAMQNHILNMK
ncbi:MAG: hypothetical protein BGO43_12805 [Gammaproteobacteria bacterium 39-13]|nr:nucleotidyltransferase domain-containing protein [Gammaproteobacteria bacterium]OJV90697.1 MAG: hypothetical protein BGO43_12805 [Gammaproteobacteria bacterium 39-13]